ncbi:MAG TPA: hypothetical protein VN798_17995, partial [Pseudomonas sp.]|nr:hypothetical protein [Pseudomonas sp.]
MIAVGLGLPQASNGIEFQEKTTGHWPDRATAEAKLGILSASDQRGDLSLSYHRKALTNTLLIF